MFTVSLGIVEESIENSLWNLLSTISGRIMILYDGCVAFSSG